MNTTTNPVAGSLSGVGGTGLGGGLRSSGPSGQLHGGGNYRAGVASDRIRFDSDAHSAAGSYDKTTGKYLNKNGHGDGSDGEGAASYAQTNSSSAGVSA